ncbi:MAG: penicillin-binding protein 1A [Gallionella sp.]|nr:penicillin-binding protein 1A [Gallionella sp.]PIR09010.1 MAG: penicillin-binding protein [Gallionellaceae bacterium CG11_big_fil_rev_8_21_14_0_20_60_62]PIY05796.1 MAG: penicillin-binding protein [Gallionellaceae bacterium CG_4_10_14_3_um_filter_60_1069]
MTSRRWFYPALGLLMLPLLPLLFLLFAAILIYPTLPSLDALTHYHPKMPLRIYSAEKVLIGEFGEERRELVSIEAVPTLMKLAILAAEDDRFYEHGGVDYVGVARAAYSNFSSGGVKQGASTITMQVARNFFLSREKTFSRKLNEMLLAFKIESNLGKDQILELYINHIYLGQRAYGFGAAAQAYFSKPLTQLSLAEMAMLAGLPKAPGAYNPVVNPSRAKVRQEYILRRMLDLGYIQHDQYAQAREEPLQTKQTAYHQEFAVNASYIAELVRQEMYQRFQEEAYTQGYSVTTTIRIADQAEAYTALRKGVLDYDRRHDYLGPEGYVDLKKNDTDVLLDAALKDAQNDEAMQPAIVLSVSRKGVGAYLKDGQHIEIAGEGLRFAQQLSAGKLFLHRRIRKGALIRVRQSSVEKWEIVQLPKVEAAFVSGDPRTGAVYALVGGYDFNRNQFNHVTQAWRQPGSSFKPFIYSAALEKGFTPASIINDAPLVVNLADTGGELWEPKNYEGSFEGPMRLRQGLIKSKNLISIRILQSIGLEYAQDYVTKFGFDRDKVGPYLTMALGAVSVTPWQMLGAYSVFANGGYRVAPYLIQRIEDGEGNLISEATPVVARVNAEQVLDIRNTFTMVNMLQDVVKHGTAIRAMSLGRHDLAGKTGTTNDSTDAWFCGFHPARVAVTWVGYDDPRSLGERETGGGAALPIWMDYMGKMLKDEPEIEYIVPPGIVTERINEGGLRDPEGERIEYFYEEFLPPEKSNFLLDLLKPAENDSNQLF